MPEAGVQQAKSERARKAICEATIDSLVEVGYAETSLNRVAATAGFSQRRAAAPLSWQGRPGCCDSR